MDRRRGGMGVKSPGRWKITSCLFIFIALKPAAGLLLAINAGWPAMLTPGDPIPGVVKMAVALILLAAAADLHDGKPWSRAMGWVFMFAACAFSDVAFRVSETVFNPRFEVGLVVAVPIVVKAALKLETPSAVHRAGVLLAATFLYTLLVPQWGGEFVTVAECCAVYGALLFLAARSCQANRYIKRNA